MQQLLSRHDHLVVQQPCMVHMMALGSSCIASTAMLELKVMIRHVAVPVVLQVCGGDQVEHACEGQHA